LLRRENLPGFAGRRGWVLFFDSGTFSRVVVEGMGTSRDRRKKKGLDMSVFCRASEQKQTLKNDAGDAGATWRLGV